MKIENIKIALQRFISAGFIITGSYNVFCTDCGGGSLIYMAAFIASALLTLPLTGSLLERIAPFISQFAKRIVVASVIAIFAIFAIFYNCPKNRSIAIPEAGTASSMDKDSPQRSGIFFNAKKHDGEKIRYSGTGKNASPAEDRKDSADRENRVETSDRIRLLRKEEDLSKYPTDSQKADKKGKGNIYSNTGKAGLPAEDRKGTAYRGADDSNGKPDKSADRKNRVETSDEKRLLRNEKSPAPVLKISPGKDDQAIAPDSKKDQFKLGASPLEQWKYNKITGIRTGRNATYRGVLKNGMRNGYGVYTWPDGDRYEGNFMDDKKHGYGTYRYAHGSVYTGTWSADMANGRGSFKWSNGDMFDGNWKNDLRNGKGTYTWADGTRYTGYFKDDKIIGIGTVVWKSGDIYIGELLNNLRHGKGLYKWADGTKYRGDYRYGKKDGTGTYTWTDGMKYFGEWKNNRRHGLGTVTLPNGKRYAGEWRDNKFIMKERRK